MATTPKANLTLMPSGIYRNEEVYNLGLIKLESLVYGGVLSRSVTDPGTGSPSPDNGASYLVPSGSPSAAGDFIGHDDEIAVYYDGWKFIPPSEGAQLYIVDEDIRVQYRGAVQGWVTLSDGSSLASIPDVDLSGSPSPANGDVLTYRDGVWYAEPASGGGSVTAPTRTSASLTGSSVIVSIPAGCTRAVIRCSDIVMGTSGAGACFARLLSSSSPITMSGCFKQFNAASAPTFAEASAIGGFMATGGVTGTTRFMSGEIISPRDAAKKTLSVGFGADADNGLERHLIADSASDDNEIEFLGNGANFSTGSVEIEWFYN